MIYRWQIDKWKAVYYQKMFIVPVVQLISPARLFVTPMDFYLLLDYAQFTLIHELNIPGSYAILSFISSDFTLTIRHIHNWVSFSLWPSQFILFGAIALCTSPVAYWTTSNLGMWGGGSQLLMSYLFAFSYSLWGSPGKNTGVGCYFFLKWTMFYQKSSKIKTT